MKVDVVEEFLKLASINSPSRREGRLAAYLVGRIREMGLPCIGLGMGAENEPTPDEFISISQLREGARFIKTLLTTAVREGLEKV